MPDQPTTIFNFEAVLDQILVAVNSISSNYVTVDRFNQILVSVGGQVSLLNAISTKQDAILAAINNLATLNEAIIAGLNQVATVGLQNQEIALLQEIIQFTATTRPARIVLDTKHATHVPQPTPSRQGP